MRVIIAGGGSGGHLFPGIAVAEELVRETKAEVLFVGSEKGIEARVVPKKGYRIKYLPAEGIMGRSFSGKIRALYKLALSFFEARKVLSSIKPDIVIGTGGYASVGPVLVAKTMSIPVMIMEQNVVPGAANKWLGKLANAVALTYQESMGAFARPKCYLTGNPVRPEIFSAAKNPSYQLFGLEPGLFTVFIFGGSSGARSINNAMVNALNYMLDTREAVQFLHQTGEQDYQSVREAYRKLGFRAMVVPFIYQMPEAYSIADLVVSRAGATTLAELTALGKPAILVPYPHAGEHQDFNARKLEEFGAAKLIRDRELNGELLSAELRRLINSPAERNEMATKSKAIGKPDAAQRAARLAMSIVKMKRKNGNVQAV
jgi:UDP-N-acetylglucosamine--N-acetylmuramyl-(pentapeptide) pyrophosphoryl-undecaprenol N-acetylglucosamine transferase